MLDRRKFPRNPAYLGARIVFDRRFATVDCLIRNVSDGGARLAFDNTAFVPKIFELTIPRRNATYRVQARWRRFGEMGVEIERKSVAASDTVIPIGFARRLRQLQRENLALRRAVGPDLD